MRIRHDVAPLVVAFGLFIVGIASPFLAESRVVSPSSRTLESEEVATPAAAHKLVFPELRHDARLGVSVATSGDTILAGARSDSDAGVQAGAVLVFDRQDGVWQDSRVFTAADAAAWAHLGYSVAIDGTTAIGGAFKDDQGGFEAGAIYALELEPASVNPVPIKYVAPNGSAGDRFGQSVAIHGDIVVVGAPEAQGHGLVYVFEKNEFGLLTTQATLSAADGVSGDHFGDAVAVAGDFIVVGASLADAQGENSGAAYVFERTGPAAWAQHTKLVLPFESTDALFGKSVAIDGSWIVVGAPTLKDEAIKTGAAGVFRFDGTGLWSQHSMLQPAAGENASLFGLAIDVKGDVLAVGAPADDQAAQNSGAVHLYRRDENNDWLFETKLTAWDAEEGDAFARSVALGSDLVVVGSVFDDPSGRASGSVYAFELPLARGLPHTRPVPAQNVNPFSQASQLMKSVEFSRDLRRSDLAVVSCPADDQPMVDVEPSFFNVCGKEISPYFPNLDTLLDQLDAGCAHGVGAKIHWEYLEPTQGQPDWTASDLLLSHFDAASLEPLVTIRGTTAWASSQSTSEQYWLYPPADLEQWRDVVYEIVSRYGSSGMALVSNWEIWNEPNLELFFLGSAIEYVTMLNIAYGAVKEADPEALVFAPAVVFHPWNVATAWAWVDQVIATGSFDVFTIHLYFSDAEDFYNIVVTLRQKLDDAGLSQVPIAVTEVNRIESVADCPGFSALPDWLHAQQLQDILACLANAGANSVYWFKSTDRGQSCALPHDDVDVRNGLLDPLWFSKANHDAFVELACGEGAIFADGFESGDTGAWTATDSDVVAQLSESVK
ncbi:MAG: hypothetical protein K8R59_03855 [Thermoanaerobaculales bacterium]|nr:hypothetical protein [Thermoanaerobaculales bacterium]